MSTTTLLNNVGVELDFHPFDLASDLPDAVHRLIQYRQSALADRK